MLKFPDECFRNVVKAVELLYFREKFDEKVGHEHNWPASYKSLASRDPSEKFLATPAKTDSVKRVKRIH